jgi:hypothetical protein
MLRRKWPPPTFAICRLGVVILIGRKAALTLPIAAHKDKTVSGRCMAAGEGAFAVFCKMLIDETIDCKTGMR